MWKKQNGGYSTWLRLGPNALLNLGRLSTILGFMKVQEPTFSQLMTSTGSQQRLWSSRMPKPNDFFFFLNQMILRKTQSLICLLHSHIPFLEEPQMSIFWPHMPVKGLQPRENRQDKGLLVRYFWRDVSPKRQAAPEQRKRGEGRDGNGQVPRADLEKRQDSKGFGQQEER